MSYGYPPILDETEEALRVMISERMGPHGLPAERLEFGLVGERTMILHHVHSIIAAIFTSGKVPQEWKVVTPQCFTQKQHKDRVWSPRGNLCHGTYW